MTFQCVVDVELLKKYSTDNSSNSIEDIVLNLNKESYDSSFNEAVCFLNLLNYIAREEAVICCNNEILREYLQYINKMPREINLLLFEILSNDKCSKTIEAFSKDIYFEFKNTSLESKLIYLDVANSLEGVTILSTKEALKNIYSFNNERLMKRRIVVKDVCNFLQDKGLIGLIKRDEVVGEKSKTSERCKIKVSDIIQKETGVSIKRVKGLSTFIDSDRSTLDDELDYSTYAYAIYKFLINKNSKPPLTISIQAPWGGGKTSLMRMIREDLDPKASKYYPEYEEKNPNDKSNNKDTKSKLTVSNVLDELNTLIHKEKLQFKIPDEFRKDDQSLTIWFNAWKYENNEQIWSGLADAIIKQFGERLDPIEGEKFWLNLNSRRVDPNKIRYTIYEHILAKFLYDMRIWLGGALIIFLILLEFANKFNNPLVQTASWSIASITLIAKGILQCRDIKDEPAEVSISKYLRVPDYRAKLGFVHFAEEDLRRVLDLIDKPIVIFIDDLDRCSPDKVANLMEAINLFLAGEFKNCIFILGMDPEIIAASLEVAHCRMISRLPVDAKSTPIGWRFMYKFVQLPFAVPQVDKDHLDNYISSLLSDDIDRKKINKIVDSVLYARSSNSQDLTKIDNISKESTQTLDLSQLNEDEQRCFDQILAHKVIFEIMDRGIEGLDRNSYVLDLVKLKACEVSRNPREVKRFINIFRFLFFLTWARNGSGKPSPTPDQLCRWVMLSIKWPEVERWLRYGSNKQRGLIQEEKTSFISTNRLQLLEDIGAKSNNMENWLSEIKKTLQLTLENAPWIEDDNLREFFQYESSLETKDRLSSAIGMGIW